MRSNIPQPGNGYALHTYWIFEMESDNRKRSQGRSCVVENRCRRLRSIVFDCVSKRLCGEKKETNAFEEMSHSWRKLEEAIQASLQTIIPLMKKEVSKRCVCLLSVFLLFSCCLVSLYPKQEHEGIEPAWLCILYTSSLFCFSKEKVHFSFSRPCYVCVSLRPQCRVLAGSALISRFLSKKRLLLFLHSPFPYFLSFCTLFCSWAYILYSSNTAFHLIHGWSCKVILGDNGYKN
jgi:hypothetical protein